MISHQYKFIFVHIGRTGGTSFEKACGIRVTDDLRTQSVGNTDFPEKHKNLDFYNENYADVFDRYFKFTIVRNPYDRLVSAWHWRRDIVGDVTSSFRDFAISRPYEWSTQYFLGNEHMTFTESLSRLDCIVRFECLAHEMKEISHRIGLDFKNYPHANKSNRRDYRAYYDTELVDAIARKYATEINYFGFRF